MKAEKLAKIKFHGLSWVVVLVFDTVEDANNFAKNEKLNVQISEGNHTAIARFED